MKKAVVLFNLGGPDKLESVQPFLFNLFNDPEILSIPTIFRYPLAKFISKRRAPIAKNIYKETQKFNSIEIKEFSLLYIILNNLDFFFHRLDLFNEVLFFSKENKILFQLIEQSLKNGNFYDITIDDKFLDNINKFATVKHIVKKNDENHSKILEIFEDIKKDLKTHSLELRIQELESKFAEDFNQNTFDEIRRLKKEQNIN